MGRGGIHCNRLYIVDEGKNNVAQRCEGGGGESTVPFFLEGRKEGGSQNLQKRLDEFLIKKYIFPFFVPLMNKKLGFKTTNVKWLFQIMKNIYRLVISLGNQLNFLDCISWPVNKSNDLN